MPARLRALSPFGPILGKELRVASRRRRNHALRVGYLAALLLILLMAYASVGDYGGSGVAAQVDRQSRLGSAFFATFTLFSVIAMLVIGPVLTSTAIGAERTHKTLHVLLMTPMSAWQIVAGKLASRMFLAVALLGLSLPVLALVRLLGGVEVWQMAAALVLAASAGTFAAALGLWLSTLITRAYAVILTAYGLMAVLYVFMSFVAAMSMRATGSMVTLWWYAITNPVYSASIVVWGAAGMPFARGAPAWWWSAVSHLAGALALLVLSARTLRRQQLKEGEIDTSLTSVGYTLEPLPVADAGGGDAAADADRTAPPLAAPAPPQAGDNPISWRELRQPMFNRRWLRRAVRTAAAVVLLAIYALLGLGDGLDDEEPQFVFAVLFNAVIWLLVTVLSATAIAQEKESDTWTLLLATPLSGRKIVFGKLLGLFWRLRWVFAVVAGHFVVFAVFGAIDWMAAALVLAVIACFNSVWAATGLYLSLRVSKVTVAVVINLVLAVALYLVLLLGEAALWETFSNVPRGGPLGLVLLPYWYLVTVIDLFNATSAYYPRTITIPPFGPEVGGYGFARFAVGACLGYLLAAGAIVGWTIARFDGLVGRARQVRPLPGREVSESGGKIV